MIHSRSLVLTLAAVLASCGQQPIHKAGEKVETAEEFVARVNKELSELGSETQVAGFTQATFINVDTELLSAKATDRYLAYLSEAAQESKRYEGEKLAPQTQRALMLLKVNVSAPAPRDPDKRAELTRLG